MLILTKAFFILYLLFGMTSKAEALRLTKVNINGNFRIETASILDKIALSKGKVFTRAKATEDVKSLFKTGFFYDIKVDLTGAVLTYKVVEKPIIEEVKYIGSNEFNDSDLSEATQINQNQLLDIKKVNSAIKEIKKKYEEKGYFLAKVNYEVKKGKKNDVKILIFNINEGDRVKIKKIHLIGNKSLSDEKIKGFMATREKGLFGTSGSFQSETLRRDQEVIGYIFRNEGYAQVKVSAADVSLTRDKRGLTIIYYIEEGLKYKIGNISFSGDVDFTKENLLSEIKIDEQEYFSQATLLKDIARLQAKYGDNGYAYTNVVLRPEISDRLKTISITFDIKKGEEIKIGEITVVGNTNTRDKVLRRELRIFEGELYNETEKRKSLANVKRLGFFDSVEFQDKVSPHGPNIMDIHIKVKERNTGQLNIGAGYGGFQGFTLQGSVHQPNFLGRGINFGLNINYSKKRQQLFNLNIVDPYFKDTDYSVGLQAFSSLSQVIDYQSKKTGTGLTVGRKYSDFLKTSLQYRFQKVGLNLHSDAFTDEANPNSSPAVDELYTESRVKEAKGYSSGLTASVSYDKRNDRQFPTSGYYARASVEQTGIGGDLNFIKTNLNFRYYKPLIGSLIWRNNLNYGWVGSVRDEVPFNELYRLGSPNTIRGYDFFTIAETRYSGQAYNAAIAQGFSVLEAEARANIPFGGTQQFFYNIELEWALVKEAGIKGVVFFDIGMSHDELKISNLKSAYGLGFRWNSPMGPLRFEWAFPIDPNKKIGEKNQNFQFSILQYF